MEYGLYENLAKRLEMFLSDMQGDRDMSKLSQDEITAYHSIVESCDNIVNESCNLIFIISEGTNNE